MAPVSQRVRRLESRQWAYRIFDSRFGKRDDDSDDEDSDDDGGRRDGNKKNRNRKNRKKNKKKNRNGRDRDNNDTDDTDRNNDNTDTDSNNRNNGDSNTNNNNGLAPVFIPEITQAIQPSDTITQIVPTPPATVVTKVPDPETVTMDATTVVLVSTVTTSPTSISLESFSSEPPLRKGLDDEWESFPPDSSPFPTLGDNPTPTGNALANSSPTDGDYDRGSSQNEGKPRYNDKPPEKDQTKEHIFIGAGSIGIFILICLVCFFGWRFMKNRKNPRRQTGGKFTEKMYAKLPWLSKRRANRRWQSLEDDTVNGMAALPRSNTTLSAATTVQGSFVGYYGDEKKIVMMDNPALEATSNMGPAIGGVYQPDQSTNSTGYAYTNTDPSLTMRSRMPDPFFNQSELARQPSDAYDPAQRQVPRASLLSSLSSGFGDGDIIIPAAFIQPPPPSAPSLRQSNNLVGRFSWHSQANTNRETIYTEFSEDSPARFRTVNSWVNQQTGRVKRAHERAENGEEVPPVPELPGAQPGAPGVPLATGLPIEHKYTMMRDFEEPKRPDKQD